MRFTSIANMCTASSLHNSLGLNDGRSDLTVTDIDFTFVFLELGYGIVETTPSGSFSGPLNAFALAKEFKITVGELVPRQVRFYYDGALIRTSTNLARANTLYNVNVEMILNGTSLPDVEFYANVWITQDLTSIYAGTGQIATLTGHGGTAIGDYEWSADDGVLSADLGVDVVTWTPPEEPGVYTITLTDGISTWDATVTVLPSVPLVPSYPVDFEVRRKVLPSQSERLVRETVTKSRPFFFYSLNFNGRRSSEYDGIQALREVLGPEWPFQWEMPHLNASGLFLFDSEIRLLRSFHERNDFSLSIRSLDALAIVEPASNVLPFNPDYSTEVSPTEHALASDSAASARAARALSEQKVALSLVFRNLYLSHLQTLIHFWAHHYPKRQIQYTDPWTNVTAACLIDSDFKGQFKGLNWVDCSFAIRGV